ncbi:MAG: alpha/beta hydrolase [Phycisphaerae bacterium]
MKRFRSTAAAFACIAVALSGCEDFGFPVGDNRDELIHTMNSVLLSPHRSCDELRKAFLLDHLPIVDLPSEAEMPFEENWVALPGGKGLCTWFLPAREQRGVVLLAYGAVGSMSCYLFTSRLLVESGWSVMMYDYRGYGRSSGEASFETLVSDFDEMLTWTQEYTREPRITLMGISVGTMPVIAVASRRPQDVNGVILDSPINLGASVRRFDFMIRSNARKVTALIDRDLISHRLIGELCAPSLFFLHEDDGLAPPALTTALFNAAGGSKQLARLPGLGHARGVFFETELYHAYVEAFLTGIWEPGREPQFAADPPAIPQVR